MHDFILLITLLLVGMGLTVIVIWPEEGPSAYMRDSLLRKILPAFARPVLDCYICLSVWVGLLLSPLWWYMTGLWWTWMACLMLPSLFWVILRPIDAPDEENSNETDAE
jgi:hypothetical protein